MISPLRFWMRGGGTLAVTVQECSSIRIEMYEFFLLFFFMLSLFFSGGKNPHKGRKKFLNWKVSVLNNAVVRSCNKIQIARMREVQQVVFSVNLLRN